MGRRLVGSLLMVAGLVACADDGQGGGDSGDSGVEGVDVPDGFTVTEVIAGLVGPTQLTVLDDGSYLVAQLDGGEGDGTGQVVRIDPADAQPTVLFDGLLTPTGVTVAGDEVWVMERRRLSRGPLEGGELTTVLDELPFNGRSEGTLTTDADDRVLYDTSGTLRDGAVAPGSATLWAVTAADSEPTVVATGFKHAYARTFAADGTLWQTEMSDGSYDGEPAPDELVAVEPGADFGWPQCIGDRTAVAEFGGTAERCTATPRSHALFPPGATPTSVAVAPWDEGVLLVALWNAGQVVAVPVDGEVPVEPAPFLTGLIHPQHLVADGDRLLVVDFDGGRILAVTAE